MEELSRNSRDKVELARRKAAAGVLGSGARKLPLAVDQTSFAVADASAKRERLLENSRKALEALEESERTLARRKSEFEEAKKQAAKLDSGTTADATIRTVKEKVAGITTEGTAGAEVLAILSTLLDELAAAASQPPVAPEPTPSEPSPEGQGAGAGAAGAGDTTMGGQDADDDFD
eukprot:15158-Pyramimonas_sp.AAC.1